MRWDKRCPELPRYPGSGQVSDQDSACNLQVFCILSKTQQTLGSARQEKTECTAIDCNIATGAGDGAIGAPGAELRTQVPRGGLRAFWEGEMLFFGCCLLLFTTLFPSLQNDTGLSQAKPPPNQSGSSREKCGSRRRSGRGAARPAQVRQGVMATVSGSPNPNQ